MLEIAIIAIILIQRQSLKSNTISKTPLSFPPTHVTEPQASTELKDRSFWINYITSVFIEELGNNVDEEVGEFLEELKNAIPQGESNEVSLLSIYNDEFGETGSNLKSFIKSIINILSQPTRGGGRSSTVRIEAFEEARITLGSELSRLDSRGDSEGVSRDSSLKVRVSITHFTLITDEYDKLDCSFINDIRAKIQQGYKDRPETKLESGFTLSRLNNHISVVNHRYKITQLEFPQKHADSAIIPEVSQAQAAELIDQIRAELFCPITLEILKDPVILEDGQTYSKEAIEQ